MSIAFASFASSAGFAFGVRVKYVISGFISGDLYWANVSLLLTGDTIDDYSPFTKPVLTNGAHVSTSVKRYGTGAYAFPNQTCLSVDFPGLLGPNDYTVEFWFKASPSTENYPTLFKALSPTGFGLACTRTGLYGSTTGDIVAGNPGGFTIWGYGGAQISAAYDSGDWHHLAIVKSSIKLYAYVDGIAVGEPLIGMVNFNDIGIQLGYGLGVNFPGYIDDFRITSGVARYTDGYEIEAKAAAYLLKSTPFSKYMLSGDLLIAFDNTANVFDWMGS